MNQRFLAAGLAVLMTGVFVYAGENEKPPTRLERQIQQLTEEKDKIAAETELRAAKLARDLAAMREEKERLEVEYALLQQRHKNAMAKVEIEKCGLELEEAAAAARQKQALAKLQAEKETIEAELATQAARQKKALAAMQAAKEKLELENAQSAAALQKELAATRAEKERTDLAQKRAQQKLKDTLAALNAEKEKLAAELALAQLQQQKALAGIQAEKNKLAAENERQQALLQKQEIALTLEQRKMQMDQMRMAHEKMKQTHARELELAKLNGELDKRAKEEAWKSEAQKEPDYRDTPFVDGRLILSDRCVRLNGPIIRGVAEYITKRIHYFNNKSETEPIFLVIDSSPGGSIMEGYRIVKAMEASSAPVHVVVKSYAASMAAVIATLAPRSYAYPNAVILHHEPWTWTVGNTTQLQEQLDLLKKWEKRLLTPVAKKMGLSLEAFRKRLYQKNSQGDWEEFGDEARKLKWVNHVVTEIRETGIRKKPGDAMPRPWWMMFGLEEKTDDQGKRYVRLPRLNPCDAYFIHNPDRYYR